jgi:hypothetical protein
MFHLFHLIASVLSPNRDIYDPKLEMTIKNFRERLISRRKPRHR